LRLAPGWLTDWPKKAGWLADQALAFAVTPLFYSTYNLYLQFNFNFNSIFIKQSPAHGPCAGLRFFGAGIGKF